MSTPSFRRVRILAATIALGALSACGGGSSSTTPPPPPPPAPLLTKVAVTAPTATIVPGKPATWTVVVTNNSQAPTTSTTFSNTVDANSAITTVRCRAAGSANCPALLAASMQMGALPGGTSLTFQIDVVVTAGTNGAVFLSSSVDAPNDPDLTNNTQRVGGSVQSYDVSVSNLAAGPTIPAGQMTTFTATIANSGPAVATNLTITQGLSTPLKPGPVTCVAEGGATCPADTSFPMSVDSLPVNGKLTLAISANVPAGYRGTATSTVGVKDDNDSSSGNNESVATATVVDARNGSYQAYATDAKTYDMTVDFDAATYAVSGNGVDARGTLTTTDQLTYAVSSNQEIRASAADLLVGAFDFGAGPKAFIAARSFATTADDIGSAAFTVFGLSTNHLGTTTSTFESQVFDASGAMVDCTSTSQLFRESACPDSSKTNYTLTFSGPDITAVDAGHNDTITMRVAKSGDARILLRAETDASCNCDRFSVGIPDNVLGLSGTFVGASSNGATGGLKLGASSYDVQWLSSTGVQSTDSATLAAQGSSAPVGLRGGVRASDGSFIWVIENAPVALVLGAFGTPADGTMELWSQ